MNEFSRTELLLGAEGMARLRDAHVMVFGVGGVGSHCIEALARSGVGRLTLVDSDRVSLTNINRQSIALHSTIGRYKTQVMKERIHDICPEIRVRTIQQFVLPENLPEIYEAAREEGEIRFLIDAIDTVTAKIALAELAVRTGTPLISSMGTGNKLHPELFEITDLAATRVCPLCRVMRRELKARGILHLKVLYSPEEPVKLRREGAGEVDRETPAAGRRSVPGSVSFVPPAAGLMIAGEVIRELAAGQICKK